MESIDMLEEMYRIVQSESIGERVFVVSCGSAEDFELIKHRLQLAAEQRVVLLVGTNTVEDTSVPHKAELKESILEHTIPKVESICYLPNFRKTRKERKQQYNNNHRKNWRKRK